MVAEWPGPAANSGTIVLASLEPAAEIKHQRWDEVQSEGGAGRRVDLKGLDGG